MLMKAHFNWITGQEGGIQILNQTNSTAAFNWLGLLYRYAAVVLIERCPARVFRMWMAVPLLARFVKNVLRPLWLLAPSTPAPAYSRAKAWAKLFAPNPSLMLFWLGRSRLWANDVNDASVLASGYGIVNAKVKQGFSWGQANLEAYLGVDNLTDRKAVSSFIINQSSRQYFEPMLPRNWVIGITAKLNL